MRSSISVSANCSCTALLARDSIVPPTQRRCHADAQPVGAVALRAGYFKNNLPARFRGLGIVPRIVVAKDGDVPAHVVRGDIKPAQVRVHTRAGPLRPAVHTQEQIRPAFAARMKESRVGALEARERLSRNQAHNNALENRRRRARGPKLARRAARQQCFSIVTEISNGLAGLRIQRVKIFVCAKQRARVRDW